MGVLRLRSVEGWAFRKKKKKVQISNKLTMFKNTFLRPYMGQLHTHINNIFFYFNFIVNPHRDMLTNALA